MRIAPCPNTVPYNSYLELVTGTIARITSRGAAHGHGRAWNPLGGTRRRHKLALLACRAATSVAIIGAVVVIRILIVAVIGGFIVLPGQAVLPLGEAETSAGELYIGRDRAPIYTVVVHAILFYIAGVKSCQYMA